MYLRAKFCNTSTGAHQFPRTRCVLSFFCGGVSWLVNKDNCFKLNSEALSPVHSQSLIRSSLHCFSKCVVNAEFSYSLVELPRLSVLDLFSDPAHVLYAVLSCFSFPAGKESWIAIALYLSLCTVATQIVCVWEETFWFFSSELWSVIL